MPDFYEAKYSEPALTKHLVRFVGGSSAVTKTHGRGITVAWVAAGRVSITWSENPGVFAGLGGAPSFQATTQADVKSYVGVLGAYASNTVELRLYESGTLTDLAALEWCSLELLFKDDGSL
jgi:hypothetical protein